MTCGILSHGFARVHCDTCGKDALVGLSCKGRGFCPSCAGRRMADTAAHLVDHVVARVPVRQWVLTLPFPLRYRMASGAAQEKLPIFGDLFAQVRVFRKPVESLIRSGFPKHEPEQKSLLKMGSYFCAAPNYKRFFGLAAIAASGWAGVKVVVRSSSWGQQRRAERCFSGGIRGGYGPVARRGCLLSTGREDGPTGGERGGCRDR